MNTTFVPRLLVFGDEMRSEIENFFGKEKTELFNLDKIDDLEDIYADALWKVLRNPYASFVFSDYKYLTIITGYEKEKLTFLKMSGMPGRVFKIDSEDDETKLEAMGDIVQYRHDLDFAADDLYRSLGSIVDDGEYIFEEGVCSDLTDHLSNISDHKDSFEYLLGQSLDEAVNQFEFVIH